MSFGAYIIRCGDTDFYKLGQSAAPSGRLSCLQTANPHKLLLLAHGTGDIDEAALHHRFAAFRGEGEWFELGRPAVDELLDELRQVDEWTVHPKGSEVTVDDLARAPLVAGDPRALGRARARRFAKRRKDNGQCRNCQSKAAVRDGVVMSRCAYHMEKRNARHREKVALAAASK